MCCLANKRNCVCFYFFVFILKQFHVGEVVTSLHRTELVAAGAQAIVYVTSMGTVGALLPSATKVAIRSCVRACCCGVGRGSFFFHVCVV